MIGTQDVSHTFHPFAFAVLSGKECTGKVRECLAIVDRAVYTRFGIRMEAKKWMLDAGKGCRIVIDQFDESQPTLAAFERDRRRRGFNRRVPNS